MVRVLEFLVALAPVLSAWAAAAALVVLACGLTRGWFPGRYWDLVKQFDSTSSWLVLARDLALVGAFTVLVSRSAWLRAREPVGR